MPIPNNISLILLPKPNLNVLDLCRFSIPSSPKTLPAGGPPLLLSYSDTKLFSNRVSMVGEGHVVFLQSLPRPSSKHSRNDLLNIRTIIKKFPFIPFSTATMLWIFVYHSGSWSTGRLLMKSKKRSCIGNPLLNG
jgi:hypothetical protein